MMKKIIGKSNTKKPKPKDKSKDKVESPSLSSAVSISAAIASETPIDYSDDRKVLSQLKNMNNFKEIKTALDRYAKESEKKDLIKTILNKFDTVEKIKAVAYLFLNQKKLDLEAYYNRFLSINEYRITTDDKEPVSLQLEFDDRALLRNIVEKENFTVLKKMLVSLSILIPEYEVQIKDIVTSYNDMQVLKYIINLYLNQNKRTLNKFYDIFLVNPKDLLILREFRTLLYKIMQKNKDGFQEDTEYAEAKTELIQFKTKYNFHTVIMDSIINDLDKKYLYVFIKQYLSYTSTLDEFFKEFKTDSVILFNIAKEPTKSTVPFLSIIEPTIIEPNTYFSAKKTEYEDLESVKSCRQIFKEIPWIKETVEHIYIAEVDFDTLGYIIYNEDNDDTKKFIEINDELYYRVNKYYFDLQCDKTLYKVQKDDIIEFYDRKTNEIVMNFKIAFEVTTSNKNVISIILQDKKLFDDEIAFFKSKTKVNPLVTIDSILKEPILKHPEATQIAKNILEPLLADKKENDIFVYNGVVNEKYIDDIIDLLVKENKTVNGFVKHLGSIVIYLKPAVIKYLSFGTFKKHIELGYYTPSDMLDLNHKQKLPEIFGDDSNINKRIQQEIKNDLRGSYEDFIEDFCDTIYIGRNPHSKYRRRSDIRHGDKLRYNLKKPLHDWRLDCENFKDPEMVIKLKTISDTIRVKTEEVTNHRLELDQNLIELQNAINDNDNDRADIIDDSISNKRIIIKTILIEITNLKKDYFNITENQNNNIKKISLQDLGYYLKYSEGEKVYCLNSTEIYDRINNNDLTNPYSGNKLDDEFVSKIKILYKLRKPIDEIPAIKSDEPMVNKGLLNLIRIDINRLSELKNTKDTLQIYDGCNCKRSYVDGQCIIENESYNFPEDNANLDITVIDCESNIDANPISEIEKIDVPEDETDEDKLDEDKLDEDEPIEDEDDNIEDETWEDETSEDETDDDETNQEDIITRHNRLENILNESNINDDNILDGKVLNDYLYEEKIPVKYCEHCFSNITGAGFKSIKWNSNTKSPDNIVFCCIKCIEDFEWKKHKFTKRQKNKKI